MKINEVEMLLDIPKATIRFYEKEGLLNPKRNSNSYREYTDTDIEHLKKIIVLRKIGVSVEEIKCLINDTCSLKEVLIKNEQNLHKQIIELSGAIKVCERMQKNEETMESFDQNYYWNIIRVEEERGQSFFDIAKDYLQFEKNLLDEVTGGGNKGIAAIAVCLLFSAIARGGISYFSGNGFWDGFTGMFIVLVLVSSLFFPVFLLRNKEKAQAIYVELIGSIAIIFLLLILLGIIILLINAKFHFLF